LLPFSVRDSHIERSHAGFASDVTSNKVQYYSYSSLSFFVAKEVLELSGNNLWGNFYLFDTENSEFICSFWQNPIPDAKPVWDHSVHHWRTESGSKCILYLIPSMLHLKAFSPQHNAYNKNKAEKLLSFPQSSVTKLRCDNCLFFFFTELLY